MRIKLGRTWADMGPGTPAAVHHTLTPSAMSSLFSRMPSIRSMTETTSVTLRCWCGEPVRPGILACSLEHARAIYNRSYGS